jgi:hypothetical protein
MPLRYGELKKGEFYYFESCYLLRRVLVLGTDNRIKDLDTYYKDDSKKDYVVTCEYIYDKRRRTSNIKTVIENPNRAFDNKVLSRQATWSSIDTGFDCLFGLSSMAMNYIGFIESLNQQVLYRLIRGQFALVNDLRGNSFLVRIGYDCSTPSKDAEVMGLWSKVCEKYQDYNLVTLDNI